MPSSRSSSRFIAAAPFVVALASLVGASGCRPPHSDPSGRILNLTPEKPTAAPVVISSAPAATSASAAPTPTIPPAAAPAPAPTAAATGSSRDAEILAAAADPKIVKAGKETYEGFCVACHGATTATGDSPSNLFDGKWHHGGAPSAIEHTIRTGVLDKGMVGWPEEILPKDDVTSVIAYLLSQQKSKS